MPGPSPVLIFVKGKEKHILHIEAEPTKEPSFWSPPTDHLQLIFPLASGKSTYPFSNSSRFFSVLQKTQPRSQLGVGTKSLSQGNKQHLQPCPDGCPLLARRPSWFSAFAQVYSSLLGFEELGLKTYQTGALVYRESTRTLQCDTRPRVQKGRSVSMYLADDKPEGLKKIGASSCLISININTSYLLVL